MDYSAAATKARMKATAAARKFERPEQGTRVSLRGHVVKSAFGRDRTENVGTKAMVVPNTTSYNNFVEARAERVEAIRKTWRTA